MESGTEPRNEFRAECGPARDMSPTGARSLDPARLADHIDRLYSSARAMCGSHEEAEDLVQETLARVLRKPRILRSDDDLGYLLRALRNTFLSDRRRAARRPQSLMLLDTLISVEDRWAPQPRARLKSIELFEAIAALPDAFRDALIAVDVMGLSYPEAACALRVREATITTRLHRARQRVADTLADDPDIAPAVQDHRGYAHQV